jgi:hypothetical protein
VLSQQKLYEWFVECLLDLNEQTRTEIFIKRMLKLEPTKNAEGVRVLPVVLFVLQPVREQGADNGERRVSLSGRRLRPGRELPVGKLH